MGTRKNSFVKLSTLRYAAKNSRSRIIAFSGGHGRPLHMRFHFGAIPASPDFVPDDVSLRTHGTPTDTPREPDVAPRDPPAPADDNPPPPDGSQIRFEL